MKNLTLSCSLFIFTVAASGCATSHSKNPSRSVASEETVCKKQEDGKTILGDEVIICDQLFNELPYIRPPADNISDAESSTILGGLNTGAGNGVGLQIIDRNGTAYTIVDNHKKPIFDLPKLPANLKMPENTYFYTIYKIVGKITPGATPTILISEMTPSIQITGCAIDSAMLGKWEGTVGTRIPAEPDDKFDAESGNPITITFDHLKQENNLSIYKDKTKYLPDAQVFGIVGHIDNMMSIPSNPFLGAASGSTIELYRVTGMHDAGDNHIGLKYPLGTKGISPEGMSQQNQFGIFSPAALIQIKTPTLEISELDTLEHAPTHYPFMYSIKLHPVQIGTQGGDCSAATK